MAQKSTQLNKGKQLNTVNIINTS